MAERSGRGGGEGDVALEYFGDLLCEYGELKRNVLVGGGRGRE